MKTPTAEELAAEFWARIPPRGYLCGLSRGHIYQAIAEGQIKSALIRRPGNLTGIRLVFVPSVNAYIEKHIQTPKDFTEQTANVPNARRRGGVRHEP